MKKFITFLLICSITVISLLSVTMAEEAPEIITCGEWIYRELEDGTVMILEYTSSSREVTLPNELDGKKVTDIGTNPFKDCSTLTAIFVPEELTPIFAVKDGVLFSKSDKRLICYPACLNSESYEIPQGIEIIGDYAFSESGYLVSVSVPDSVTAVGKNPFRNCNKLETVNVSSDHPVLDVQEGAVFTRDDRRLISYLSALSTDTYEIPEGTTSIGDAAFECNYNLVNITIPESVDYIGDHAFESCSSLMKIAIPDGVTSVGDYTFSSCKSLENITIPESIEYIGARAFDSCTSLAEITLPEGLISIGDYAFYWCKNLTSVIVPEGAKSIGKGAFEQCSSLTSIIIPASVEYIGDFAFTGCNFITVTAAHDSCAAQYCIEIGYNFIYPDTENDDWLNN